MPSRDRRTTTSRHLSLVGTIAAAVSVASLLAQQPTVFRSEVDVLPVDVVVLDRDGRPVPGLEAGDFTVVVDGRARKVISAQFLSSASSSDAAPTIAPRPKGWNADDELDAIYVRNDRADRAAMAVRTIAIAIDQSSFGVDAGRRAAAAARGLLDLLHATDRVGLFVYPAPGPVIGPTRDHGRVRLALDRVSGLSEPFPRTEVPLTVMDALGWTGGGLSQIELLARVCSAHDPELCRRQVEESSGLVLRYAQRQTRISLHGLTSVIQRATETGPATIVVISTGLFGGGAATRLGLDQELQDVSRLAAESRATLYALYVESGFLDQDSMERSNLTGFSTSDGELRLGGLRDLVGASGGTVMRVGSGAEGSFRRAAQELSAYYLLGVEGVPGDRDGRRHRIGISTVRPGLTVRSHEVLYVPARKKVAGDDAVREALRGGQPQRALPIRLSTQMMREPGTENVRLLISAYIDREAKAPATMRVGYSITGAGAAATTGTTEVQRRNLAVVGSGPEAVLSYVDAATLTPGRYLLRVAATDEGGRVGSVQQVIDATLVGGEGVALSDLLLVDPSRAPKDGFAPVADGRMTGDALEAFLEIYPLGTQQVSSVVFEISDAPGAQPLLAGAVVAEKKDGGRLSAGTNIPLGALPSGAYALTARVLEGDRLLARVNRPFRVERTGGGEPSAALAFAASGRLVRNFAREDVLRADAIDDFLERMRVADTAAPRPALASAAEAVRAARFDAAMAALENEASGVLSVAFLRGLARFGRGELEPAAREFREALRISNDFLPAAFYLGACYAAGGRDREAVGAWQTSLVSGAESRMVYEVLADAWLRLGEGQRAESIILEAQQRWPGDDVFAPRLAAAQAVLDRRQDALATLAPFLERHARDPQPLFLAVRLLYEAHDRGKPIRSVAEDGELARKYGALYAQTDGANRPLVARWVAAMTADQR